MSLNLKQPTQFAYAGVAERSRLRRDPASGRGGLTLVEMMVSLACVILLMLAYTQLFSDVGTRITDARSMIELQNRMRTAASRLRTDLASHTCDMLPWQRPEAGVGYFEYIEGPLCDLPRPTSGTSYRDNGMSDDTSTPDVDERYFLGDTDDVLMFTVRSNGAPYTGTAYVNGAWTPGVPSQCAEVVWFLRPTLQADGVTPVSPATYTLYRRTFLVIPSYNGTPIQFAGTLADVHDHDHSLRLEGTNLVANTLGDLTKRESRYAHFSSAPTNNSDPNFFTHGYPHRVDPTFLVPFGGNLASGVYSVNTLNSRYGQDVVLTNVVGFDVQVWDPTAPVYNVGSIAVGPGDPGFPYPCGTTIPATPTPASVGAFVDLNWHNDVWTGGSVTAPWNSSLTMSPFYSNGHPKSLLTASIHTPAIPLDYKKSWLADDGKPNGAPIYSNTNHVPATFDTWSFHYEHDGLDQDRFDRTKYRHNDKLDNSTNSGKTIGNDNPNPSSDTVSNTVVDQGTDGFDNNGDGVVDDPGERETSPPYPVPLRGIKIRIRCYEPDSRQFHEVDVVESFVPE